MNRKIEKENTMKLEMLVGGLGLGLLPTGGLLATLGVDAGAGMLFLGVFLLIFAAILYQPNQSGLQVRNRAQDSQASDEPHFDEPFGFYSGNLSADPWNWNRDD